MLQGKANTYSAWPGAHPTGSSQCKSTGVGRWEGRWVELGDAIYQYVSRGMCHLNRKQLHVRNEWQN